MSADTCIIGTRGSKLALWQAHAVEHALQAAVPGLAVEVRVISTKGDRVLDKPLADIGDKGLFTKELERALLSGEVDLCVHSMKDLPTELPAGCCIAAVLPRADVRDALVCGPRVPGARSLAELPTGTRLGTGSRRRVAQLRSRFPQVEPLPMRGNVDTRLAKAKGDDYDGAILAAAGLSRMGFADAVSACIPVDQMVPAAGQGAVGVEARVGDARAEAWCAAINDAPTMACVAAERQVMRALGGGCQAPVGAHVREEAGRWVFDAVVLSLDGGRVARSHREIAAGAANTAGERAHAGAADAEDHRADTGGEVGVSAGAGAVAGERADASVGTGTEQDVRAATAAPLADLVTGVLEDLREQGAWDILAEIEEADANGE